jgi:hypothetical protein
MHSDEVRQAVRSSRLDIYGTVERSIRAEQRLPLPVSSHSILIVELEVMMPRSRVLWWAYSVMFLVVAAACTTPARADSIDDIARAIARGTRGAEAKSPCEEHCFVLDKLSIRGSIDEQPLRFRLTGHSLAVPLFGPPNQVRLDDVRIDGKPAAVGFDKASYVIFTGAQRFHVEGDLYLDRELTLTIPGPLNTFEASLDAGRVVEGDRLSGVQDGAVHFDLGKAERSAERPAVFQLSRAIRIERTTRFEYYLELVSSSDLGVVRLPLEYGERVLEVQGAPGWRIDGTSLLLPTADRRGSIKIKGTLESLGPFKNDARSAYEWWLVESDPEHRLEVTGAMKRADVTKSPVPATQASARLFLLQAGETLKVESTSLSSAKALATVLTHHERWAAMTPNGDLLIHNSIQYTNNGIDYLPYRPGGKAIYLSTDGKAEQLVHETDNQAQLLIPLLTGNHVARVQEHARHSLSAWGGRILVPTSSYPVPASTLRIAVGLPEGIHPILASGGDHAVWRGSGGDLVAMLFALAASMLLLRTWRRRLLGALVFGGLWFVWPLGFVMTVAIVFTTRLIAVGLRVMSGVRATVFGTAVAIFSLFMIGGWYRAAHPIRSFGAVGGESVYYPGPDLDPRLDEKPSTLSYAEGVRPVPMPVPEHATFIQIERTLVGASDETQATVYYCTDLALHVLLLFWGLLATLFVRLHVQPLRAWWKEVLARVGKWDEHRRKSQVGRTEAESAREPAPAGPELQSP